MNAKFSRRKALKTGMIVSGTAMAARAQQNNAPAVITNTQTGRKFRGFVRTGANYAVEELRLLPIAPRQIVYEPKRLHPVTPW